MKTMENKSETMTDRTAAPSSQSSSAAQTSPAAPKRYVVNHGFDKLFFLLSIPFIAVSSLVVFILVYLAVFGLPETRFDSAPDFVKSVTGGQYELIVHKLGPIDDNLFRSSTAYVLVRTDADVVSNIEHMAASDFKFVPMESAELEIDKESHRVYDSIRMTGFSVPEIDKVYQELAGTPPGADCRYFFTRDDPDYFTTYLCFSPESKLLLIFRDMKRWGIE